MSTTDGSFESYKDCLHDLDSQYSSSACPSDGVGVVAMPNAFQQPFADASLAMSRAARPWTRMGKEGRKLCKVC